MEPQDLVLRMQWNWGGEKIVKTNSFEVIGDCVSREGFVPFEGSRIFGACNGRAIDLDMTFSYYNIRNGSKVVLCAKRVPGRGSRRQFGEMRNQRRGVAEELFRRRIDVARREEIARLDDLAFASWECETEFATMMKDMLKERKLWMHINRISNDDDRKFTIIEPAHELCCEPLRMLPQKGDMGDVGECSTGCEECYWQKNGW